MLRRRFPSASLFGLAKAEAAPPSRIIDTHIHLYDRTGPSGVPSRRSMEGKRKSVGRLRHLVIGGKARIAKATAESLVEDSRSAI